MSSRQRSITVMFEGVDGLRAAVGVRHHGRRVLSRAATDALLTFVEHSSIQLPRDKEVP